MRRGPSLSTVILAGSILSAGCRETRVTRAGPVQQRLVARTYAAGAETLRARVLDRFAGKPAALPVPFSRMTASELKPPRYDADWLVTYVDPGGFLAPYKRLVPADRAQDLLLEEPTGEP